MAGYITQECIDRLKAIHCEKILQREGYQRSSNGRYAASWRGGENPNSVIINEDNTWHDFGANEHHDSITLYANIHKLDCKNDFMAVCKSMCNDYGIPCTTEKTQRESPKDNGKNNCPLPIQPSVEELRYSKIVARYPYADADGNIVAVRIRFEPKTFRTFKSIIPNADINAIQNATPDPKQWIKFADWEKSHPNTDLKIPLYSLPRLLSQMKARPEDYVLAVEGEKDCDNCAALGFISTSFKKIANVFDYSPLMGRKVIVIADYDEIKNGRREGDRLALEAVGELKNAGAEVVKVVYAPNADNDEPFNDISDWIQGTQGSDKAKSLREYLETAPDVSSGMTPQKAKGNKNDKDMKAALPENLAVALVDSMREKDGTSKLLFVQGEFHLYDLEKHCWILQSHTDVEILVTRFLQTFNHGKSNKDIVSCTRGNVNNIILNLQAICAISSASNMTDGFWIHDKEKGRDSNARWLILKNGLLETATGEICEHTPLHFSEQTPLDYEYDPNADGKCFRKFLTEIQPDLDKRKLLQLIAGLCLVKSNLWHVAFILVGDGGNGKSLFAKCLKWIIGEDNCTSIPIDRLDDKFQIAELKDSWLNVSEDMAEISQNKALGNILEGNLKTLISGEDFQFERKYKDPITAKPTVKFVFCTNSLPYIGDKSNGLWRRLRIIAFNQKFGGTDKEDPNLENKLAMEKPAMLNWALEGAKRLMAMTEKLFPDTDEGRNIKAEQRNDCDATGSWLKEHCEMCDANSGMYVESNALFSEYNEWYSSEFGKAGVNKRGFRKTLKRVFPTVKEIRKQVCGKDDDYWYYGICKQSAIEEVSF